jgi:hypothetical protein
MPGPASAVADVQGGATPDDYTFDGIIPKLGPAGNQDEYPSLLPHLGGQPGYEYYVCPVTKQREAQNEGWKAVQNTNIFTIKGPLGQLDLVLLCQGSRIAGGDTTNNKRVLFLDPDVEEITGLDSVTGKPKTAPKEKSGAKKSQS